MHSKQVPSTTISFTKCVHNLDDIFKALLMRITLGYTVKKKNPAFIRKLMLH